MSSCGECLTYKANSNNTKFAKIVTKQILIGQADGEVYDTLEH